MQIRNILTGDYITLAIQHGHEAVTESNGTALLRCDLHCLHICVPSCRIILNRSTPCSVWRLGITLFYATARKICRRNIGVNHTFNNSGSGAKLRGRCRHAQRLEPKSVIRPYKSEHWRTFILFGCLCVSAAILLSAPSWRSPLRLLRNEKQSA